MQMYKEFKIQLHIKFEGHFWGFKSIELSEPTFSTILAFKIRLCICSAFHGIIITQQ